MQPERDRILEFLAQVENCANDDDLIAHFQQLASALGFQDILVTGLPAINERPEDKVVFTSWPEEWQHRYVAKGYGFHDPVGALSYQTSKPFLWSHTAPFAKTKLSKTIMHEAQDFGLVDGIVFPTFDPENWQSVVSLSCPTKCDFPHALTGLLYLAVSSVMGGLATTAPTTDKTLEQLTSREREVLSWTAMGKTMWEVSEILSISQNTVSQHLVNIREKLDAANTIHAVAKAIRTKQIRL